MNRRATSLIAGLAALALAAPATASAAQAPRPFGHACHAQNGVRFCPTTSRAQRVPTFDGVPLDADVTLPAHGSGPFPTIVMLHGFGGSKTDFESSTPAGKGTTTYHYNNTFYAQQGYAVLNYTVRGFGDSCGGASPLDHSGSCGKGYIRLADTRYEAHDAQALVGMLADEGIVKPGAIGVTGISYGGGQSLELAYLRNRIRRTNGSYRPWLSPSKHIPLSITAAYPRWPWSDLVDALLPNGRYLDSQVAPAEQSLNPVGVPIQSYITGLFALAGANYLCGTAPASTPCMDRDANLILDRTEVLGGEPLNPDAKAAITGIYHHDGASGVKLSGGASPLLIENGWTDDLFPPEHALRVYNQLRARNPNAPVSLQFGDLGHSRGTNKARVNHAFDNQGASFFAARLKHTGTAPAPGSITAYSQTCPKTVPDGGPFTATSYPRLHAGTIRFGSGAAKTFTSAGGDPTVAAGFDPIAGTSDACKTIPTESEPDVARYTRRTPDGFTLLGLPTITAHVATTGPFGEIAARLWDVSPDGTQRLITRGLYRLTNDQTGRITFQLHGNAYYFAPGHTTKLELLGRDAPYYRASNFPFTVKLSNLTITMPKAADPRIRLSVRPGRVHAGHSVRYTFIAVAQNALRTNKIRPVGGALVRFAGHSGRTDAQGHLTLRAVLRHAGRYTATATHSALRPGTAHVRAVPARRHHPRSPGFTG